MHGIQSLPHDPLRFPALRACVEAILESSPSGSSASYLAGSNATITASDAAILNSIARPWHIFDALIAGNPLPQLFKRLRV